MSLEIVAIGGIERDTTKQQMLILYKHARVSMIKKKKKKIHK